jgi:isopentenyl diphosphate isomerase/L-lactate dehydrogenase-like FMN-dependent dehydrogenase
VPARSNRESERRTGMGMPPILNPQGLFNAAFKFRWWFDFLAHNRLAARMLVDGKGAQAGVESVEVQYSLQRPDLDWDDFAWIRANWEGQVFIKGVLHPDDAEKAVDLGADGVMVSNHGGRQLDFSQASLDALPAIVERVGHRVPVLLDGGVRRGTDVVKALCLGATAVGIGRPYIYGLSADGQRGVEHVLEIFREEIATTLTLLGVSSVRDLGPEYLVRLEP